MICLFVKLKQIQKLKLFNHDFSNINKIIRRLSPSKVFYVPPFTFTNTIRTKLQNFVQSLLKVRRVFNLQVPLWDAYSNIIFIRWASLSEVLFFEKIHNCQRIVLANSMWGSDSWLLEVTPRVSSFSSLSTSFQRIQDAETSLIYNFFFFQIFKGLLHVFFIYMIDVPRSKLHHSDVVIHPDGYLGDKI